jgi:hypothetical protein
MEDHIKQVEITAPTKSENANPSTGIESSALAAINDYLAENAPQTAIGLIVKFSKHGEFLKGPQAEAIPEGTLVTAACDRALVGFIMWVDGKPIHKVMMISSGKSLYQRAQLGHHDRNLWEHEDKPNKDTPLDRNGVPRRDPWKPVMYVPMMTADGEIFTLSITSKSGINSANQLLRRYATHAKRHPTDYPLIKLTRGSFAHKDKTIGDVLYPDFEPAGWVNRAEFDEALQTLGIEFDQQTERVEGTTAKQVERTETPAALPKPRQQEDEFQDSITF